MFSKHWTDIIRNKFILFRLVWYCKCASSLLPTENGTIASWLHCTKSFSFRGLWLLCAIKNLQNFHVFLFQVCANTCFLILTSILLHKNLYERNENHHDDSSVDIFPLKSKQKYWNRAFNRPRRCARILNYLNHLPFESFNYNDYTIRVYLSYSLVHFENCFNAT